MSTIQKTLLILAVVMVLAVFGASLATLFWIIIRSSTTAASSPEADLEPFEAAQHDRRDEADKRRAALSSDSGLPTDWTFEEALKPWHDGAFVNVRRLAEGLSGNDTELGSGAIAQLARTLAVQSERSDMDDALDPTAHTLEEIQASFEDFIRTSPEITEFETAIRAGVYYCEYDFAVEWYDLDLPWLEQRSYIVDLLAVRSGLLARDGQCDRAAETYLLLTEFAEQIAGDPYIENQTEGLEFEEDADRALWSIIDHCEPAPGHMDQIVAALDRRSDFTRLAAVVREDAALNSVRGDQYALPPFFSLLRFLSPGLDPEDDEQYIEAAESFGAIADKPPHEVREQLIAMLDHENYWVSSFLESAVDAYRAKARGAMYVEILDLVLALKSFKTKTGGYPAALAELKPDYLDADIPVDALTGRPIIYLRIGDGFRLLGIPDPDFVLDSMYYYEDDPDFPLWDDDRSTLWIAEQ